VEEGPVVDGDLHGDIGFAGREGRLCTAIGVRGDGAFAEVHGLLDATVAGVVIERHDGDAVGGVDVCVQLDAEHFDAGGSVHVGGLCGQVGGVGGQGQGVADLVGAEWIAW